MSSDDPTDRGPGRTLIGLFLLATVAAALALPVNPWPRDGWFAGHERLFGDFAGEDNVTPIAVPAVFFRLTHSIAAGLGLGVSGEMYVASLGQNLLLFLTAVLVYLSCRLVARETVAATMASAFLLFVLSTGLPQAFWSENTVISMFAAVLLLNVRIYADRVASPRRLRQWSVASGLLIGGLVITRVTPLFLVPAFVWFMYPRLDRKDFASYASLSCAAVIAVVLAMMASNAHRFGRFEITNSTGRHLWQGVTAIADTALANSREYASLRHLNDGLQGKNYWEIMVFDDVELAFQDPAVRLAHSLHREQVLRRLSTAAIKSSPMSFLGEGIRGFATTIGQAPYRLGFGSRGLNDDPLNRSEPLPPLVHGVGAVSSAVTRLAAGLLRRIYDVGRVLYPVAIFIAICHAIAIWRRPAPRAASTTIKPPGSVTGRGRPDVVALAAMGVCGGAPVVASVLSGGLGPLHQAASLLGCLAWWLLIGINSVGMRPADASHTGVILADDHRLQIFLAAVFFGSLYFSWQVEADNSRNAVPYLPWLSLMLAAAIESMLPTRPLRVQFSSR